MKYLVLISFAGPEVGSHAAGEEIELNAQDAKALAPFIQPVAKLKAQPVETASLEPDAESADVKMLRKKKG